MQSEKEQLCLHGAHDGSQRRDGVEGLFAEVDEGEDDQEDEQRGEEDGVEVELRQAELHEPYLERVLVHRIVGHFELVFVELLRAVELEYLIDSLVSEHDSHLLVEQLELLLADSLALVDVSELEKFFCDISMLESYSCTINLSSR